PNLAERLNRELRSKVILSKHLGEGTSLTSTLTHTVNLDNETRTDNIPLLSLSLPVIYPFGNGTLNDDGKLEQKWYHNIKFRYSPSLLNFSSRITRETLVEDSIYTTHPELAGKVAGQGVHPPDILDVEKLLENKGNEETGVWNPFVDTLSWRSRKKFVKFNNSPTLYLPTISFGNYLNMVPSFTYREVWFKIIQTDQSDSADVDPGVYRTYSWNTGITANTKLFGTVRPNLFGLTALRHIISPSASYSYTPDIDRNPTVRSYAGGGAGSRKSSKIAFTLGQDFQAKVMNGGDENALELFTLRSSFSYDFEADSIPFSDLVTKYQSRVVPNLDISGQLKHSFYEPGTSNLDFWSPYRQSFTFNATLRLKGIFSLFDEPMNNLQETDMDSEAGSDAPKKKAKSSGGSWGCTLNYRYGETGRKETWRKTQDDLFIQISVNFKLTPATTVSYAQRYDFREKKTINNSVSIVRKIHCWTGSLHWVPTGSNRGFGFKLCVTELPEIKIDNGHDDFLTGLQRYR
ncbi:MAG: putative LPS assembly protein LptD, partial [candidate division Zixibacteria bacterium]|nr:putative LPS assembly protein LptD [candidate division Zixibacteria bacterium]